MATKHDPEDSIIKEEMGRVVEEIKRLKQLEKKNSFSGIFKKPQPTTSGKSSVSPAENKKKEEVSKSPDLKAAGNKMKENEVDNNRQREDTSGKKDNSNLQNMKYVKKCHRFEEMAYFKKKWILLIKFPLFKSR